MRYKTGLTGLMLAAMCVGMSVSQRAEANNIAVTNVALDGIVCQPGSAFVKFDLSWDNSWRASWTEGSSTITNWDAAWIFVKYRVATGNWQHASLSTNDSEHVAPAGSAINVGLSTNSVGTNLGAGVFIYRSAEGSGSWTNTGVKLTWNYTQDGVASTATVDVSVYAIEMVYVPQGSFYVGDGETNTSNLHGRFETETNGTPFLITSESDLTLGGGAAGSMGNNNGTADDFNDATNKTLPAAFPKGYNAFYCMKYEVTQGQYKDFLDLLTRAQQANRVAKTNASYFAMAGQSTTSNILSSPVNRNGICTPANVPDGPITFGCDYNTNGVFDEANDGQDIACNWVSRADGMAYADWAGLRPMTELEYEKACRGPLTAVLNEYAWGNTTLASQTNFCGTDGSGIETAYPSSANCCSFSQAAIKGPVRVGIYAKAGSTRTQSGATYWGIMEMSGNLWERVMTAGNTSGRSFTGGHGDGVLTSAGSATNVSWSATGVGTRGDSCYWGDMHSLRISDRSGAQDSADRYMHYGWRMVRSSP